MVNSPLPESLASECRKAGKTVRKFIKPDAVRGPDSVIPSDIITRAKGLAIITVIKAGFIWSGRIGSGLVVARLPDGSWSAPSAIGTAGVGFGGQIGGEIIDFIFILNSTSAVKAFSMGGNVTLGGNLSVAAGPVGRAAEASGTIGKTAAVLSYSKSKGLFAGISLEGSVLMERKDANASFYGRRISAKEILSGAVERPAIAQDLYNALDLRTGYSSDNNSMASPSSPPAYESLAYSSKNQSASSHRPPPPIPTSSANSTVVALYDFKAERPDDLEFKANDIITVIRRTDSKNDWWTGSLNGKTGNFPANYVE